MLLKEGAAFTLYALKVGESVDQFLQELEGSNPAEFARIMRRLDQLAERGPTPKREEFNDLGDGLFEAKSSCGARIIFFYDRNRIVLCAQGFLKKSQKTPKRFLRTASDRRDAYMKAKQDQVVFQIHLPDNTEEPRRTPQ